MTRVNSLPTWHYSDVIMSAVASLITRVTIVYSTVYSGSDQRKHQSSVSLAFVWRIHQWPVNSPHKEQVMWKMFQFDDIKHKCTYSTMATDASATTAPGHQQPQCWINIICIGPVSFRDIIDIGKIWNNKVDFETKNTQMFKGYH